MLRAAPSPLARPSRTRAWKGWRLCYDQARHKHHGAKASKPSIDAAEQKPNSQDLLAELFPELDRHTAGQRKRSVPRLSYPNVFDLDETRRLRGRSKKEEKPVWPPARTRRAPDHIRLIEQYTRRSRAEQGTRHANDHLPGNAHHVPAGWASDRLEKGKGGGGGGRQVALLILYHASAALVESDFRRAVPTGKHIKEWQSQGDILQIISGRDPDSLLPLGFYFLLFSSYDSAQAYRSHAAHLHALARKYTPRTFDSPLPPPPGYTVAVDEDGAEAGREQDVHAALQAYTLMPPSQTLTLKVVHPPFTPAIQQVLAQGGYAAMQTRARRSSSSSSSSSPSPPCLVRFHLDGIQLPLSWVRTALEQDGKTNRIFPWKFGPGNDWIGWIDEHSRSDTDEGREDKDAQGLSQQPGRHAPARFLPPRSTDRWIISFQDRAEARRFVRVWHMRPFPLSPALEEDGEVPPVVYAECLWS
ncbi:MAG: hypothetical protein M1826_001274 [Phylliscum demangeonii]|nr:MAG: hypothetical protein M1826_001274 [Phylliscum demangeonii]